MAIYVSEQPFPTTSDLLPHQQLDQIDNGNTHDFQWKSTLLSHKTVSSLCSKSTDSLSKCKVYLVFQNKQQTDMNLSFKARDTDLLHPLKEGQVTHLNSKAFQKGTIKTYLLPESADSFLDIQAFSSLDKFSLEATLSD